MEFNQLILPLIITLIAGLSTGLGSFISLFIRKFNKKALCFSLGLSAGVMVYVSFGELLPAAIADIGFLLANVAFFAGILFIMALDFFIPHNYIAEKTKVKGRNKKLMSAGLLTAIGVAIHNLPEGIAVFVTSAGDLSIGIALAVAVAIHNIPEGIAISIPIFYATKSKKKAFLYSFGSGFVEPIGALIAILILMPILNPIILAFLLAFVAGVMVFISFDELLPLTFKEKHNHISVLGVIIGMFVMALSLAFI